MKKSIVILTIVCLSFLSIGCGKGSQKVITNKHPVKVIKVKEETYPIIQSYTGTIDSKELKKYSFKIPGKIGKINVKKGQQVKKGDILAQLNTKDLNFAFQEAQNTLNKAQEAYNYTQSLFKRVEALYEVGGVSKQGYDNAKLELELAKSDLKNAQVNYENKKSMLQQDARIISNVNGYIVDVIFEEGEVVSAGYPVIAIRTGEQIVNVGLSQQDVRKVNIGMKVKITIDDTKIEGEIINIDQVPDLESRTYNVEISLPEKLSKNKFYLGAIVDVSLKLTENKGILVPINCIMSNGSDFVFVVKEGKAVKKEVKLGNVVGNKVAVQGLSSGSKVVIEGMKSLDNGYDVIIKQ